MQDRTSFSSHLVTGALSGLAAWSAYAFGEFLYSSGLFRMIRPYAMFTSWHWELTGQLMVAYILAGLFFGALAGAVVFLLGRTSLGEGISEDPDASIEYAATVTLASVFLWNVIFDPIYPDGTIPLRILSAVLIATLVLVTLWPAWRERLGLLPNSWVVAALLLGGCQHVSMGQLEVIATQFGFNTAVLYMVLWGIIFAVGAVACFLGRRVQLDRYHFGLTRPSQAAIGLMVLLTAFSLVAGQFGGGPAASKVSAQSNPPAGARPNLVVIVMDTTRADHLSVYGYKRDTTPNLRKLAEDSAVFPNAIAASDVTLTSHSSLFTGMYPSWHGAFCQPPEALYGGAIHKNVPTLAERLHAGGYKTIGVAANLYLRADFGLQRGFDVFRIPRPVPILAAENSHILRQGVRRWMAHVLDTAQFDRLFSRGQEINEQMFSLFDSANPKAEPFFVFMNYMDAHFPYVAPAPFNAKFRGENLGLLQDNFNDIFQEVSHGKPMPEREKEYTLGQYDGGIAYIDAQIGQVMDWLKRRNLYDNTMIVVTSDHGEAFGERFYVEHGNSPYQNLINVAMIVKFPHSEHKGVVQRPVSNIDVFPTALSVLGQPHLETLQGKSMLEENPSGERAIFSETFPCPVIRPPECRDGCYSRAMVAWPHKYISMSNGKLQVFDLSKDRDELTDLKPQDKPLSRQLGMQLTKWVKSRPEQKRQQVKLDAESLERLKSLGYVQGNK